MTSKIVERITKFFVNYFSLNGQLVSQSEAETAIREGVSFRGTNILILILAIFIASLGLNTNSTAVIIGAMLISPLMGPIIGIGLGVGIYDFDLIKRCLRNLIMAAAFSVAASTIYFLISPVNEQHSELLARTSPTIYDVLIGFVGGGAGIIALGSTNKGNVIPGVAIATALMPPLCTAGYGLATWQLNYFFGATYLFIINSIYIAFATFIGVKLMKYRGVATDTARAKKVRRWVYILAILTMLPSIYLTYNMLQANKFKMSVDAFVAAECHFPQTRVLERDATDSHGKKTISLTLIGAPLSIDSLRLALEPQLKFYGLSGAQLNFIQGSSIIRAEQTQSVSDIYRLAQATISRQQNRIDSLQALLAIERMNGDGAPELSNEIKVLFPNVKQIGITTTVFANIANDKTDTVTVALISAGHKLSRSEKNKLTEYLQARLKHPHIRLIEE